MLRPYDQYGNLIADLSWLNEKLRAEQTMAFRVDPPLPKSLVHGPGGVIAVRITGETSLLDTTQTVIVRSALGDELLRASITLLGDPSLYVPPPRPTSPPAPTVAVDSGSIITVREDVHSADLLALVTVTSTRADRLHYALMPDGVPGEPTPGQLLSGDGLPDGILQHGQADTSGTAVMKLRTVEGKDRLYVVASAGTRVSAVAMVEIELNEDDAIGLAAIIDATDEADADWTVQLVHNPADAAGTVYYVVTDNPLLATPEEVVDYANGMEPPEDARFVILKYGHKAWDGTDDTLVIPDREQDGTYHIYVVLAHRGILLLQEGELNRKGIGG